MHEIKLDKVRPWKPFFKVKQHRPSTSHLLFNKRYDGHRNTFGEIGALEMGKLGYEVCAEGPTRVLRICLSSDSLKRDSNFQFSAKMQLRISQLAIHLLELRKQVSSIFRISKPVVNYFPPLILYISFVNLLLY